MNRREIRTDAPDRTGEIWTRVDRDGNPQNDFYILKDFGMFAIGYNLCEEEPRFRPVQILAKHIMWTDAGRISYVIGKNLETFVRVASEEEQTEIKQAAITAVFEADIIEGGEDNTTEALREDAEDWEDLRAMIRQQTERIGELEEENRTLGEKLKNDGSNKEEYSDLITGLEGKCRELQEENEAGKRKLEKLGSLYEALMQKYLQ